MNDHMNIFLRYFLRFVEWKLSYINNIPAVSFYNITLNNTNNLNNNFGIIGKFCRSILLMQIQPITSTVTKQSLAPTTTVAKPMSSQTQTQKNDLNPRNLFTTGPANIQFTKALRSHLENIYYFK